MRVAQLLESLLRGFKILVRDVACPILGMYLVFKLAEGQFEVAAIPVVAGLASALIGITYWSRTDERKRNSGDDETPRRKRRVVIDSKGVRWGEDDDSSL